MLLHRKTAFKRRVLLV